MGWDDNGTRSWTRDGDADTVCKTRGTVFRTVVRGKREAKEKSRKTELVIIHSFMILIIMNGTIILIQDPTRERLRVHDPA